MARLTLPLWFAIFLLAGCSDRRRGDDDDDDLAADGDADSDADGDADVDADADADGDGPVLLFSTDHGDFRVQLDPANAPRTTANFLRYVDEGFYDDTLFHRVVRDFVIQGGGYGSDGSPKATHEAIADEVSPDVLHVDGAISMANAGPNTATSQFFVCDGAQPRLDGTYAAFGVTIEGMDVVRAIAALEVGDSEVPSEDVVLETVVVE